MISFLLIALFVILSALLLLYSADAFLLASMGLTLWLERMVPTLFPFMILSGIMTGLNLQYILCRPLQKPFGRLFAASENETYCILMGYLCGFPMGAFCAAELCRTGRIGKNTAQYLISFCNNIGPIYFFNFALAMIGFQKPTASEYLLLTIGMYGIPFLYGICTNPVLCKKLSALRTKKTSAKRGGIIAASVPEYFTEENTLLAAVDHSINRSGLSILRLCGYMVLFNVLMLPLYRLLGDQPLIRYLHCFFEISGGLQMIQPLQNEVMSRCIFNTALPVVPIITLTALSFGGLSCIGQTSVFLHESGLSVYHYMKSRIIIAFLAFIYYVLCFLGGFLTIT